MTQINKGEMTSQLRPWQSLTQNDVACFLLKNMFQPPKAAEQHGTRFCYSKCCNDSSSHSLPSTAGGNDPPKFSNVFIFVMLAMSVTAVRSASDVKKKKKHRYANLSWCLSAVLPGWGQAQQDAHCGKLISFMANFPSSCLHR